jgi:hypothetical protein
MAALAVLASCGEVSKTPSIEETKTVTKARISLEDNERMFENMRSNPGWNEDGELLWGYFFTDRDPEKLKRAVDPLTRSGYRFGSIYPTDDGSTYFLHVEKFEKHTPQTLHLRNTELYRFADEYQLESYDGMDVGPVLP